MAKHQTLNPDQGCQFTSQQYIVFVKENVIHQSMGGNSRWADNIMIERWFCSFKYEEAYLTQYNNIKEARIAIEQYVRICYVSQSWYCAYYVKCTFGDGLVINHGYHEAKIPA